MKSKYFNLNGIELPREITESIDNFRDVFKNNSENDFEKLYDYDEMIKTFISMIEDVPMLQEKIDDLEDDISTKETDFEILQENYDFMVNKHKNQVSDFESDMEKYKQYSSALLNQLNEVKHKLDETFFELSLITDIHNAGNDAIQWLSSLPEIEFPENEPAEELTKLLKPQKSAKQTKRK